MPERDPRIDPKPGDVVSGFGLMRKTVRVLRRWERNGHVYLSIQTISAKRPRTECLEFFRIAAKDAEVLYATD